MSWERLTNDNYKNKQEIEYMRSAGKVVAETLAKIEEAVKPGITTMELDKIAEDYITKCGAKPSFKGYYGFPGLYVLL